MNVVLLIVTDPPVLPLLTSDVSKVATPDPFKKIVAFLQEAIGDGAMVIVNVIGVPVQVTPPLV